MWIEILFSVTWPKQIIVKLVKNYQVDTKNEVPTNFGHKLMLVTLI